VATSIVVWVLCGLAAAVAARFVSRTEDIGWVGTILLGIVGSLAGGACSWMLNLDIGAFQLPAGLLALGGAVLTLLLGFLSAQPHASC
jgi:uncharacterized membrane protein YeaQ/YmgE (transglycosylase-associated protein family)